MIFTNARLIFPDGVRDGLELVAEEGKITAIREDGPNADVQLRLRSALLIARITRRSLERLSLEPGASVFALIKSVTVGGREAS